jgi:hypothetical protein
MHNDVTTSHSIDPISVRLIVSVLHRVCPKREIEPAIARSIAVAATRIISLQSLSRFRKLDSTAFALVTMPSTRL